MLLDFPYVFELDGNKLYCSKRLPSGYCGGEIDYDAGFNKLVCSKCGKVYFATELKKDIENKLIICKESSDNINVKLVKGDKIICENTKIKNSNSIK